MRPFFCYKSSSISFSDADMTRILTPSVAEYTIEYNGAGSLHIEHPADNEGKWKAIQCGEIIMAPIMRRGEDFPQPFRIYKVTKTRRNGIPIISADALHIFYDLNYCTVIPQLSVPARFSGFTVNDWLNGKDIGGGEIRGLPVATNWATWAHRYVPGNRDNIFWNQGDSNYWKPAYALFTKSSDISGEFAFSCNGETLTDHISSILELTGGALFVDKRRFSINTTLEGAQSNGFNIAYGLNLEGISQSIDTSNVVTLLNAGTNIAYPSDYTMPGIEYADTGYPFSRQANIRLNYNTSNESATSADYAEDAAQYFSERSTPKVAYSVQLTARQISDEVKNIATYEVGDTGTIYDPDLDINTTQMITKKVVDLMTQRVKSVELSSTNNRSFRRTWSNTITSGQSALEKRLNSMG